MRFLTPNGGLGSGNPGSGRTIQVSNYSSICPPLESAGTLEKRGVLDMCIYIYTYSRGPHQVT